MYVTQQTRLTSARLGVIALGASTFMLNPAHAGGPCEPGWDNTLSQPGMGGTVPPSSPAVWVQALIEHEGDLHAAGWFTTAGGVDANRIARLVDNESVTWEPLGDGVDDFVWDLIEYDGDLIAAGRFATAGGVTVNGITRWDGSQWLRWVAG